MRNCAGAAVVVAICSVSTASADECPGGAFGYVVTVQGVVEISAAGGGWQPAQLDTLVCKGDVIRVGEKSRAGIYFDDTETVAYVDQNTTTAVAARPAERSLILDLLEGAINFLSREPRSLEIRTPFVNAGVKGTEFEVRVELDRPAAERPGEPFSGRTIITLVEGRVEARVAQDTKVLVSGQSGEVRGDCPSGISLDRLQGGSACIVQALRLYARLPDAVQWALYYPPLTAEGSAPLAPDLAEASRLLARGRVDEALPILCAEPAQGEKSALLAIVELTRNDPLRRRTVDACGRASERDNRQRALDLAEQAVRLSPRSAAAWVSLSYARQAYAKLDDARAALEQAVAVDPNDALARARLAEIWLSLGYRDRALKEAERAKNLSPTLSRTQTVSGFAALAEIDLDRAQRAFASAIERDTADPLPRFGLGLVKIRDGKIAAGRSELEIAAGLDPQNSLIRSYLGKAYFEEKRDPLDAEQLAIAKKLDPLDPTPWLYDAIRLQTENRPGEALQAIRKSIELNDNRAIYRSRQVLDQDQAARETSQGRIYDDLGFQQLGVNEASKSLTLDPTNASAHRFLSDIYNGVRRREIARVSELLQAQLLQDININPVQPSISETNLNIITRGGPAETGFNEFTPLFERNDAQLNVSGLAGDEGTFGGEGVVSALYDKFSISAGAFHYETDGWRPNNEINHDIYNVYAQGAITPELNLQIEYRHRESDQGDLAFNFNPNSFNPLFDRTLNQDIGRFGLRYSPTPNSDLLLSFIYSDREEDQDLSPGLAASVDDQGSQIEAQYLYGREWLNLTTGFGNTNIDTTANFIGFGGPGTVDTTKSDTQHVHGYVYANINLPDTVTWTVGLSVDDFEEDPVEVSKVNPKLGVQWDVTNNLRLRAAIFRTIKPALVANRTIEPTQIAGFNQFFDDGNADEAWRYGVGLDWRVTNELFVGAEATWRDLSVPIVGVGAVFEDQKEQLHRAYVNWTPVPELALSAEFVYDRFESEEGFATDGGVPKDVETFSIPLAARYFHPSGLFAGVGVTYVNQDVTRTANALMFTGLSGGEDDFVVVDAVIGYRFPDRFGAASLEVNNLLDEEFQYQDDSFREFGDEPSTGPYTPDLQIIGRVTLNW